MTGSRAVSIISSVACELALLRHNVSIYNGLIFYCSGFICLYVRACVCSCACVCMCVHAYVCVIVFTCMYVFTSLCQLQSSVERKTDELDRGDVLLV